MKAIEKLHSLKIIIYWESRLQKIEQLRQDAYKLIDRAVDRDEIKAFDALPFVAETYRMAAYALLTELNRWDEKKALEALKAQRGSN